MVSRDTSAKSLTGFLQTDTVLLILFTGLLSDVTMKALKNLPITKLVVCLPVTLAMMSIADTKASLQLTNSIDQTARIEESKGLIETIDIAPLLAESIRRTHNG